ncbi:MAG TPA: S4 domain-containing protein, partial [Candidatus Limnocylindrales bacterium]|nr:S4 domain-containing protein [Candidatus Limnocylindrales bacterium]
MKQRLDQYLVAQKLVPTRSQAESYIKIGDVRLNGKQVTKPGTFVEEGDNVTLAQREQYVSPAGLKLESVSKVLKLNFRNKVILDVGSSTGGFTDYALRRGAQKSIAVELGTDQL